MRGILYETDYTTRTWQRGGSLHFPREYRVSSLVAMGVTHSVWTKAQNFQGATLWYQWYQIQQVAVVLPLLVMLMGFVRTRDVNQIY